MPDHDPLHHPDELDDDPDDLGLYRPDAVFKVLEDLEDLEEIDPETIDLEKVPRRLWEQTLAPLHRQHRVWLAEQLSDKRLQEIAMALAWELDMADGDRRRARDEAHHAARRTGVPLPTPHAGGSGGRHEAHDARAGARAQRRDEDPAGTGRLGGPAIRSPPNTRLSLTG